MEEQLEKRYRLNLSWDYEKEEQWINQLSAQGLHLMKPGTVKSWFKKDPSVRYSYCLDYQPGLKKGASMQDYFQLYQDAGWEYVTSYNGIWHYFRKIWEPAPTPKLYTDQESLAGQYQKMQRILSVVLCSNVMIFIIVMTILLLRWQSMLWTIALPVTILYILLFILLGYGYRRAGRKIKQLSDRF